MQRVTRANAGRCRMRSRVNSSLSRKTRPPRAAEMQRRPIVNDLDADAVGYEALAPGARRCHDLECQSARTRNLRQDWRRIVAATKLEDRPISRERGADERGQMRRVGIMAV